MHWFMGCVTYILEIVPGEVASCKLAVPADMTSGARAAKDIRGLPHMSYMFVGYGSHAYPVSSYIVIYFIYIIYL